MSANVPSPPAASRAAATPGDSDSPEPPECEATGAAARTVARPRACASSLAATLTVGWEEATSGAGGETEGADEGAGVDEAVRAAAGGAAARVLVAPLVDGGGVGDATAGSAVAAVVEDVAGGGEDAGSVAAATFTAKSSVTKILPPARATPTPISS